MIDRRSFIGAALAGLATPVLAAPKSPNVLFIAIDDMNDWIGPLGGYPIVHTPNLERLAKMGQVFTNAHTAAPACGPARSAVLFGIEPYKSGHYTMKEEWWRNDVLRKHESLPRAFHNRGYRTFGTGKLFHGTYDDPARASEQDGSAWSDFFFCSDCEEPDGPKVEKLLGYDYGSAGKVKEMPDYRRAQWMVNRVLRKERREPFFAAIGFSKPHLPFIVPKAFFDLYDREKLVYPPGALDVKGRTYSSNDDVQDLPGIAKRFIDRTYHKHRAIRESGEWLDIVHAYLASISFTDHCIGLLLDALPENTIVVLWSDHGWQLGEKLAWQKFTLWERATRIPLMLAGPGITPGRVHRPVSSIDIYPTLMSQVFDERPNHLDGMPLGNASTFAITTWMLPEDKDPHFSIRTEDHRAIFYNNGSVETYDHRVDPYEWNNTEDPKVIKNLRPLLPVSWAERNG